MESVVAYTGQSSGASLLDEVIYLASLASDRAVIDPIMDTVRSITANMKTAGTLSEQDAAGLKQVRSQLTDHLLHHDPVRSFTAEGLERKVGGYFAERKEDPHRRQSLRAVGLMLLVVMLSAPAGIALSFAFPLTSSQHLLVGAMFAAVMLYVGIAWLYWSSLKDFQPRLKHAFTWICAGFIFCGIAAIPAPLRLAVPGLSDTPIFRYGLFFPLFALVLFGLYMGTRIFAQALDVHSRFRSISVSLGAAVGVGLIVALLPHPTHESSDLYFRFTLFSLTIPLVLAVAAALLARSIARRTTEAYARAMRWFSITMLLTAIDYLNILALVYFWGQPDTLRFMLMGMQSAIPGIFMVVSGYMFKRSSGTT